jgi:hypothetical protein
VGFAISDENNSGLGFVPDIMVKRLVLAPEYILVSISPLEQKRRLGISLNLTNLLLKAMPKTPRLKI